MVNSVVSACHGLKLIPVYRLSKFVNLNGKVRLIALGDKIYPQAIPGSVVVSCTGENRSYHTRISFSLPDPSIDTVCWLRILTTVRIIAVYIDEHGRRRVAGSPDHPLALEISEADGVVAGVLTGECRGLHPFQDLP